MYQVLYRKYRPKTFADVCGQEHVTSTLKNEIKEGRISHAYLFTGCRGTGKTTCARILAKAVNCENSADGEPCNECEMCKGLDSGSIYDVVEIDAASNNGVDNIRDLREDVNYMPTRGKYRVYIIDEVHMLSIPAFNALLKTLEEPPAHVIFILGTTEVHKLPATILSRCQRFDFKRIQPETMAARLKEVASCEGITLQDDAAVLISRIADGALRDALSILDQCMSRSKDIDAQLVSRAAGIAGRESLYDLLSAIISGDSSKAMEIIAKLHENSYDMERFAVEMINYMRNLLITKTVKNSRSIIVCTDDEYNSIKQLAKSLTLEKVIFALDLFQSTLTRIKSGAAARIEMETAVIRLCQPKLDTSIDALNDRISALEGAVKNGINAKQNSFTSTEKQQQIHDGSADNKGKIADVQQKIGDNDDINGNEPKKANSKENSFTPACEPLLPDEDDIPPIYNGIFPDGDDNSKQKPTTPINSNQDNIPADAAVNISKPILNDIQEEQQEFAKWADFLDIIHRTDIALFGLLKGARGYVRGEFFLIDSNNPTIKEFIKLSTHSKAVKKALFDITGVNYKLGLLKKSETAVDDDSAGDPLDALIGQARMDNINLVEK